MSAFRGSGSTDTGRFEDKTIKMMNKIKFPPELDKKINMVKVELEPFKKWIAMKTESILGIDDDILTNLIFNLLQKEQFPNARYIYVQLVPFLERHVRKFMIELWELLDSAQESGTGIPEAMLDTLRQELDAKKREQDKIGSALEKRYGDRGSKQIKKEKNSDKDFQDFRANKQRERQNEIERQKERGRDRQRGFEREERDRDRDRDRDRRGRRRSRERSRDERDYSRRERSSRGDRRDLRSRRRNREREEAPRRSSRSKRQPRSPEPPRVKKGKKRKQMPSPSPPACLKRQKQDTQQAETSKRSSSSESSSSDDSSSSSDSGD